MYRVVNFTWYTKHKPWGYTYPSCAVVEFRRINPRISNLKGKKMSTTDSIRLFDYFDAKEKMVDAEPEEKRDACVNFAIDFALERGIHISDAEKFRAALIGTYNSTNQQLTPGSLSLISWKLYIADVTAIVRLNDQVWQPIGGHLTVPGRNNTKYDIGLREHTSEDTQRTLAVGIEKKGAAYFDASGKLVEHPFFWTYAGVVLQTKCRATQQGESLPGLPLTLAFDIQAQQSTDGNGKTVTGRWSSRMYLTKDENGQIVNRLDTLMRGPNDEQRFLEAIIQAGFPVHTARINRQNPAVRTPGSWQTARTSQPRSLVGAGGPSMAPPPMPADPFQDE